MKGIKWITLMIMSISFLSGCSLSPQPAETVPSHSFAETEDVTGMVTAGGDEESASAVGGDEESAGAAAGAEDGETAESLTDDSIEKEFMLRLLWGKMLQEMDTVAPSPEDGSNWDRTYEVDAYLRDFTLDTFKYAINLVYPEKEMSTFVYYWPDYIQDVREYYQEADEHLQSILEDQIDYAGAVNLSSRAFKCCHTWQFLPKR